MKQISAALFLTNGEKFLVVHVTGGKHHDLPKGMIELDEVPISTCIRETKEETGLVLKEKELIDLGIFPYMPKKDLHIFLCKKVTLPDTELMTCTSTFIHYYTKKETPEVDRFLYISFDEKESYITKNLNKTLDEVIKKIKAS